MCISSQDWEVLEKLCPFLEVFYHATVRLSSSYNPTSGVLLEFLVQISEWYRKAVEQPMHDHYELFQSILHAMKTKFLKYWENIPLITVIANCLDPRFKIETTVDMIEMFKGNFGLPLENEKDFVTSNFEAMYSVYAERRRQSQPPVSNDTRATAASSSSTPLQTGSALTGMTKFKRGIKKLIRLRKNTSDVGSSSLPQPSGTNEIGVYLITPLPSDLSDDDDIDVLDYWSRHREVYPILASMAREVYAVPVSTVASECCFSAASRTLTDKRSRLKPPLFEALVLLKDWAEAEDRHQDKPELYDDTPIVVSDYSAPPSGPGSGAASTAPGSEADIDTWEPEMRGYYYQGWYC